MSFRKIVLAAVAATTLAAPLAAFADPEWGDHDGERWGNQDRGWGWGGQQDGEGRGHEWREHERWEHRVVDDGGYGGGYGNGYGAGWGYAAPRCYWQNQYDRSWWGGYETHRVQVCR